MKKGIFSSFTKSLPAAACFLTAIVIISSCPTPINEEMFLQVKDSLGPAIIISSPDDGAYCAKTVVVTGTVSDFSNDTGGTGQVKTLIYEILSTSIREEITFDTEGNFSFNFNTTSLSSNFVLKISAEDWNGNTADSSITLNIMQENNIPSFTAIPGNHQVTLEWDDVPLSAKYTVYYATGGTIPSEQVGTCIDNISSPYTITGLDNTTYCTFLLASQSNDGMETNWSGYEYAIPLSPLTLLPQLRNEYGAITLSWEKIQGYDKFRVYRSNELDGVYSNISGIINTNYYIDNSCEPDINYYYKISPALDGSALSSQAFGKSSIFESTRLEMVGGVSSIFTSFKWAYCEGDYLYVVYSNCFFSCSYYLNIYDITNPEYPVEVGRTQLGEQIPVYVTVHNNYAYAASSNSLYIIDIQDKTNPFIAGTCGGFSNIQSIAVSDTDVCVADGLSGLHFINIGEINNPVIDDTFDTEDFAHDVALTPTHAYVVAGDMGSGVYIINLSDYSYAHDVDTNTETALSIDLQGDYAYIVHGTEGLSIIDISSPSSAYVRQTCDIPGNALDITVIDNFAYISAGTEGIVEINVTDPGSRIPFVTVTNSSIMEAVCITNMGNYIYVVDSQDAVAPIKIYSTNPNTPNMNNVDIISPSFGFGAPIACDGRYFYTGSYNAQFSIVDMTTGNLISQHTTPEDQVTSVVLHGDYAIVSSGFLYDPASYIEIINIQDPQNPFVVKSFIIAEGMSCIAAFGDYAFAVGVAGLMILDISDPSAAFIKQTFGGVGWGVDIAVQEQLAYIAAYSSGFKIVDFSNLNAIRVIGSVQLPDYAHSVVVKGSYAYVGVDSELGEDYVQIIDVSDPKYPKLLGQCVCGDTNKPNRLSLDGDYLFSINGEYAMHLSNPAEPYRFELIPRTYPVKEFCELIILGSKAYFQSSNGIEVVSLVN